MKNWVSGITLLEVPLLGTAEFESSCHLLLTTNLHGFCECHWAFKPEVIFDRKSFPESYCYSDWWGNWDIWSGLGKAELHIGGHWSTPVDPGLTCSGWSVLPALPLVSISLAPFNFKLIQIPLLPRRDFLFLLVQSIVVKGTYILIWVRSIQMSSLVFGN